MTEKLKEKPDEVQDPPGDPEEKVKTMLDMADVADVVKRVVEEHAASAIKEAVKPFVEKGEGLANYADAILDLERRKAELNTPEELKGCKFARYARLNALGKGDWERGIREARKRSAWGADDPVVAAVQKALTASDPDAAGSIVPPEVSREFIELLRNRTVVRSSARVLPMPLGHMTMSKQTQAATAHYVAESEAVAPSEQKVGDVKWSFKKLVVLTPVSNSLLRFSSNEADQFVRDDMLAVQALKEDLEFLQGDGDEDTPVGILNRMAAANKFDDTGTGYDKQIDDYTKAIRLLEVANVPLTEQTGFWFVHPQPFWGMYKTTGSTEDATSPFQAGLNMSPPRLLGYEVKKTNQVGDDRIYFVHGPSLIIGDSMGVDIESFSGAAYDDGGTLKSAVSRDETVIRAISEHDFNMRHDEAAAVIETVTVGS